MNLFFVVPCIIVKIIFYLIAFLENKHWPIFWWLLLLLCFVFLSFLLPQLFPLFVDSLSQLLFVAHFFAFIVVFSRNPRFFIGFFTRRAFY